MGKIHELTNVLADQIAAGEVIERPASIVKELVENSLDANSKRIDIIVENSGLDSIRVIDDGSGMMMLKLHLSVTLPVRLQLDAIFLRFGQWVSGVKLCQALPQ